MRLSALALTLFAYASLAGAQELPDRVGRLSLVDGTVSIYQDPEIGWEEAFVNSPITSENSVWTERGARAEVQVGASVLRLDGATQLDVWRLDADLLDARVEAGSLGVRIRYRQASERYSIATPHARFELQADGRYRIDVDLDRDESRLTVFSGRAALDSQRGLVRVNAGRSIVVYGESAEYVAEAAQEDDFDRWSAARDREWRDGPSRNYVSTYVTGYEDLDRYGEWSDDASYGALWFPASVAAGWAPYRYGHWGFVRPWGWTWIDDARWGYAPFHYGRWVYVRDRWAWSPGQRVARPTWAPALVAWVGSSNFSIGASGPALGWYPLAPWERYQPWYQAPRTHTDRVNVAVRDRPPRDLQGRGDWRTWNREHGATVVNRDTLVNRRPVGSSMVRVAPGTLRDQPVAQGTQVLPQRNEWVRRRAETRPAPAPLIRAPAAAPPTGTSSRVAPPTGNAPPAAPTGNPIVRPDFSRRAAPPAPAPAPANQPPATRPPGSTVREREPRARDAGQEQARDAQQRQQQQEQERAAREAQQRQQQQQQQQDRAARDAQRQQQQEQDRAAREAQQRQQQQQQQQDRATRDAQRQQQQQQQQQEQDRAAREAQQRQQQQQQQQDRAARDAQRQQQQEQERAAREAQQRQQQQQQDQERAARDAQRQQQQQQEQAREAQRQLQQRLRDEREEGLRQSRERQQQREQAQREQVQREAQERAIRESQQQRQQQPQQQQPQQQQPQQQPQERAQPPQGREAGKAEREKADKDKGKDKDKDDKR